MPAAPEAPRSGAVAVTGAVLAGGASRRMGRDKRGIEVAGVPLLRRAVDALSEVCDELLLVTRPDRPADPAHLAGLPVRTVHDRRDDAGPLAGVEAALDAARHELVLIVAADLPWLAPPVLARLAAELAAAEDLDAIGLQATAGTDPEPLLAAYRRRVRPTVTALLDAGERRARALPAALRAAALPPGDWHLLDPAGHTPTNVNAPVDLQMPATSPAARSALRAAPEPDHGRTGQGEVLAIRGDRRERRPDVLAGEEPMEIRVAGPGQDSVAVAVTMRTPGHEAELAVGFLHSEGLVAPGAVADVGFADPVQAARPDDTVTVHLHHAFDAAAVADRHFAATASCGICGKASLDGLATACPTLPAGPRLARSVLSGLPDRLRSAQQLFASTGGLHASGLFAVDGSLVCVREDVGRHNALDKVVGAQLLAGALPLHDRVLLVSGRVSFELVQKAAVAGIPILAAISAPSDLAVAAAERCRMTLVGFLRGDGLNCYAGPERLDLDT